MKRSTVMLLVCLVFFNSALIAYSYQNQHSINVVVDPGGGQSYNAEPASYAPSSENFQASAIPIPASGPGAQSAQFRPHIGYARPITKVAPAACPPLVA